MVRERLKRGGWTLVELLAAMALASVLLISVIGVVGRLARTRGYLLEHHAPSSWKMRVRELVRRDMIHARQLEIAEGELRLFGFGGHDYYTGRMVHDRGVVVYRVIAIDGRFWLVRQIRRPEERLGDDVRTDLVCRGVEAVDVRIFDGRRGRWSSVRWGRARRKRLAAPDVCRVVFQGQGDGEDRDVVVAVSVVRRCGRTEQ